jgi:hypothetical protein
MVFSLGVAFGVVFFFVFFWDAGMLGFWDGFFLVILGLRMILREFAGLNG